MNIKWESTGEGSPLLLIQGLGYGRWGWEPIVPGLAARHRVVSFDNRGIGESTSRQGRTPPRRWPKMRCRCSTRRASSARTCSARASAG